MILNKNIYTYTGLLSGLLFNSSVAVAQLPLPFVGAIPITPEEMTNVQVEVPNGSLQFRWLSDGEWGTLLDNQSLLDWSKMLNIIDYPDPLPEWKQKEESGICPQFLTIPTGWSSNFQVFLHNEKFSIVPEAIGDEFSVAFSYCVAINDPAKAQEIIKSTLIPHTWCIKHWVSLRDFDVFIWDTQMFDSPLIGIYEDSAEKPLMYKEFIYGSNAYETKPAQSHNIEDTSHWIFYMGVNHPEGFVTLATAKSNCKVLPLVR